MQFWQTCRKLLEQSPIFYLKIQTKLSLYEMSEKFLYRTSQEKSFSIESFSGYLEHSFGNCQHNLEEGSWNFTRKNPQSLVNIRFFLRKNLIEKLQWKPRKQL